MSDNFKPLPSESMSEILKYFYTHGTQNIPAQSYLQNSQQTIPKQKDFKSPLTKKWSPAFHFSIRQRLAKQSKQKKQRIRTISNGLTMPDIATVPIGSAKKMVAAILFFDLENFTAISSKLSKETVLYMLNIIIPEVMQIIRHWHGEIEKNTGDGLMAIFGTETRNDFLIARDAIEAAMSIRYIMLNDIHPKLVAENLQTINFRVGIDMAELLISRIGIKNTNFLTVVGDAANRASELQSLAESNGVCIGENIYKKMSPLLHQFCKDGKHDEWQWHYENSKQPYRFFHYEANWPEPKEWIKVKP